MRLQSGIDEDEFVVKNQTDGLVIRFIDEDEIYISRPIAHYLEKYRIIPEEFPNQKTGTVEKRLNEAKLGENPTIPLTQELLTGCLGAATEFHTARANLI